MINTNAVFNDRKTEIEFYYSVMVDIENETSNVLNTVDNNRFFRIMKSNFLLMLYNFVEAVITTGMAEIYEQLSQDQCPYDSLIDEIQKIWRDYKIKEVYKPDTELKTYTNRIQQIVTDITESVPLKLTKGMLGINGNLNSKRIKALCDRHRIRYRVTGDQSALERVRVKRNALTHGDESFSYCARDLTLSDLEEIKDAVFLFISEILNGMQAYFNDKQYLRPSAAV